jgi:hypothetical protein
MKKAALCVGDIERVKFLKRDEVTSDLICCEILSNGLRWTYHEEMAEWEQLLTDLNTLPGFAIDWFENVSQPPFASSEFIAFQRETV